MPYRCECCDYTTDTKQNYEKHIKTAKHRKMIQHNERDDIIQSVKNHFDIEFKKLKDENEMLKYANEMLKEDYEAFKNETKREYEAFKNETKKEYEELKRTLEDKNYINIHGNNIQGDNISNNHYHIHLNLAKYGTESYPDDTKALTDAIKGVNKAIPSLVKLRHFDPRHPENQNIKIPNKKQNKIQVYDGKRWITEDKRMTIEDKLQEFTNFMDTDEGQEIYEGCSMMIREKLDKLTVFCDKVHSGDKLNREEQRELKRITGDVENIILDHQKK